MLYRTSTLINYPTRKSNKSKKSSSHPYEISKTGDSSLHHQDHDPTASTSQPTTTKTAAEIKFLETQRKRVIFIFDYYLIIYLLFS